MMMISYLRIKNLFLSNLMLVVLAISCIADTAIAQESGSKDCEWGCQGWWFPNVDEIFSRSILVHPNIEYRSSINFKENNKFYTINVDLPNIDKKDISINIVNNTLVISAERKEDQEITDKTSAKKQHFYSSYRQSVVLPENANINQIEATLKNGAVIITIPKTGKKVTKKLKFTELISLFP